MSTDTGPSNSTPTDLGAAAAGSAADTSRSDHVHPWAKKVTYHVDISTTPLVGSADTNGTANTPINVGAALPARAIIVAVEYKVTTPASGGSVATAKLDVGYSGAQSALLDALDLVAASAGSFDQNSGGDGAAEATLPLQAGGKQLTFTVTPDGSHKLSALTAGVVDINVYYVVPF